MEKYENFQLLIDGKNAFPEILRCIQNAKQTLKINMFIWRDDNIGNQLGQAVLDAAERGVQVEISADRYGVVLEKAEEAKKSFFHKEQTLSEKIKIKALELFYPYTCTDKKAKDEYTPLYEKIMAHPNVQVEKDVFKADHSKYYVIDGETLILGGVNIEDKENGADLQGREYQDYMVKIVGKEYVDAFLDKVENGFNADTVGGNDYYFGVNTKRVQPYLFEMERLYLSIIRNAKQTLNIHMAYFSPLKKFIKEIVAAWKRGVKVCIVIPQSANFQKDSNYKTVKTLLKKTNGEIEVYLTPKMAHTKLIATESVISLGSTNITKKAFKQLSELNLFVENTPCKFVDTLVNSMSENVVISQKITSHKQIKYNPLVAFVEGFLV